MKNNILSTLQSIGLSEKEAVTYLTLLELNESLPGTISRRSGIKRPTTYVILDQLQKKGIVSHVNKKGNLFYRAVEPQLILEEEQNKFNKLRAILPELEKLNQKFEVTPQMSVYEGKDGLIQIMEDTLTTKTDLCCWANPQIAMELLEDYYPYYVEKKVERKIWLRGIFCSDSIGEELKAKGKEELREVYLIPSEKFPFKNEINIYDDKVAIISHQDQIGIIIQNKNIADTQKSIFNLGFEYAKILEANRNKKGD